MTRGFEVIRSLRQLGEEVSWSTRSTTGKHSQPSCRSQHPVLRRENCPNITPRLSTETMPHEIAHHRCDAEPPHGPEFVATYCALTEAVMGPEVGHVLRAVYANEGVRFG
jgi:hypothetical protein